jgi:homoserine dehydrogenase
MTYRLALIGFGTVGQGFAEILRDRGGALSEQFGAWFRIVAVSDVNKGSVYDPDGLEPAALLDAVQREQGLESLDAPHKGWDALTTIEQAGADVIAELSYTDLATGEPGFTHVKAALEVGKNVITSNKGPVALRFPELLRLASEKGVSIGVEGTVMSGTPTLALATELLAGAGINGIRGILNGTTNYILTRMGEGSDYPSALAEAQAKGYAEADPTGDVEGIDAAGKVVILSNLVLNEPLTMQEIERHGISQLTPDDVRSAAEAGEVWKLIATLERTDGGVRASVKPTRLSKTHPLASIYGATNAVTFTTDLLGDVTLSGPGAGKLETGYALIADLLAIHRRHNNRHGSS